MTAHEIEQIERLRSELHAYHVDVAQLGARLETYHTEVVKIATDMYGLPGNKESSPGLMGDVAEHRRALRLVRVGLRGAWALLTVLLGAAAAAAFKKL